MGRNPAPPLPHRTLECKTAILHAFSLRKENNNFLLRFSLVGWVKPSIYIGSVNGAVAMAGRLLYIRY